MSFDHVGFGNAFSGPGMDTRQWVTYGIVQPDQGDQHSVRFNGDDGAPLPAGPMVDVKLEPSGIVVPCRVMMKTAGAGEAEWDVLGPGDEVQVLVNEGDERAGCSIIGRYCNTADTFPSTVAGMDVTQNTLSFKRLVSPYVLETSTSYLLRQAKTGASLSIDNAGAVILASGDGHTLALNASVIGMQLAGDTPVGMQVVPGSEPTVQLFNGPTTLQIGASKSEFQTSGVLRIATGGVGPGGHAVTLEQVVSIVLNMLVALNIAGGFNTLAGYPATLTGVLGTIMGAGILGASTPSPLTGVSPGGILDAVVGPSGNLTTTIAAALTAFPGDPAAFALPTPIFPGPGKASLMF